MRKAMSRTAGVVAENVSGSANGSPRLGLAHVGVLKVLAEHAAAAPSADPGERRPRAAAELTLAPMLRPGT
jgi:hypothetical protein